MEPALQYERSAGSELRNSGVKVERGALARRSQYECMVVISDAGGGQHALVGSTAVSAWAPLSACPLLPPFMLHQPVYIVIQNRVQDQSGEDM